MIMPWQVWGAQIDDGTVELVLVVSSEFAIRANLGKLVTILPINDEYRDLDYRIPVKYLDGETLWVMTDQIRTITAVMHPVNWTLADDEIAGVKHALKHMVAFA